MKPDPDYPPIVEAGVSIFSEFREFIARGNVIDLAVGVIIGAAFNKIVTVLVDGIIMPPIGIILGGVDFSDLTWVLRPDNPATAEADAVAIQYGAFINTVIQFLIVAWAVFVLVKIVNTIRRKEAEKPADAAPAAPPPQEALLMEIRDLLKSQAAPSAAPAAKAPAPRKPPAAKA